MRMSPPVRIKDVVRSVATAPLLSWQGQQKQEFDCHNHAILPCQANPAQFEVWQAVCVTEPFFGGV